MICRYEHFDKKIQVYDLLVVELFKVHLDIEKEYLPSWITIEDIEENNCKYSVYSKETIIKSHIISKSRSIPLFSTIIIMISVNPTTLKRIFISPNGTSFLRSKLNINSIEISNLQLSSLKEQQEVESYQHIV